MRSQVKDWSMGLQEKGLVRGVTGRTSADHKGRRAGQWTHNRKKGWSMNSQRKEDSHIWIHQREEGIVYAVKGRRAGL